MEGNFLSRYNNKIDDWLRSIETDPSNKIRYETEMALYIGKCMPYIHQYIDTDSKNEVTMNNVFNCKETSGLQKKDIYTDYLVNVEKINIRKVNKEILIPSIFQEELHLKMVLMHVT